MFICKAFDSVNYGGFAHTKKVKYQPHNYYILVWQLINVQAKSWMMDYGKWKMELRALHGICK